MNFAKKETVIELLEYLIRLSEMQADSSNTNKEAPISADFLFFVLGVGDVDLKKTGAGIIENTTAGRYCKFARCLVSSMDSWK